jgi:hypothetical protein
MLTYRLGRWQIRKYCTKTAVEEQFHSRARTGTIRIRNNNDTARLLNTAKRHGIQVLSAYAEPRGTIGRYISSPDVDHQREAMFTSVSHYVGGAFDSEIWDAEKAPGEIIREYLNWAYGSTPSSFKLLSNLVSARMCYQQDRDRWAATLLRLGFVELNTCLCDQTYQTLPVILFLLRFFREQPPKARKMLLEQCLELTDPRYARYHPIRQIFEQVSKMEQGDYDDKFCDSMFTQATSCFVDKLSVRLKESGDFVCAILRNTTQLLALSGSEEIEPVQHWVDPGSRHEKDPEYFDSSQNVENCIVQAVEVHGYPELLQVKAALEQREIAPPSDQVRQMLTRHLRALEVPIHRIGYRDCTITEDKDGFIMHWEQLTDNRNLPQDALNPEYLQDMLFGWRVFTKWEKNEEVQRVEKRLWEVFDILDYRLKAIHGQE